MSGLKHLHPQALDCPAIDWMLGQRAALGRRIYGGDLRCGCSASFEVVEAERPVLEDAEVRSAFVMTGAPATTLRAVAQRLSLVLDELAMCSEPVSVHGRPGSGCEAVVLTVARGCVRRMRAALLHLLEDDPEVRSHLARTLSDAERERLQRGQVHDFAMHAATGGLAARPTHPWQFGEFAVQEDGQGWLGARLTVRIFDAGAPAVLKLARRVKAEAARRPGVRVESSGLGDDAPHAGADSEVASCGDISVVSDWRPKAARGAVLHAMASALGISWGASAPMDLVEVRGPGAMAAGSTSY